MFGITNMNTLETFGTQLYTDRNKGDEDVAIPGMCEYQLVYIGTK